MAAYDFLIVGAGSAGSVLADRLSESGKHSVCLLEAGAGGNHIFLKVPAGWAATFHNPKFDWGYSTEPEPELNNRQIYWPRGYGLGGSSGINGMIYIRGHALDFDLWAQAGAKGWSYEEVLPYFIKAEKNQRLGDEFHGTDGPLHVQDVRDGRSIHDAFLDGAEQSGLPKNSDFNGADQTGVGYYQFTQHNGSRWSTAAAYLDRAKGRSNLTIETHALATKIIFQGNKATGVRISQKGKQREISAQHVVLCGGAINTPQLLELSGVGDEALLKSLGIDVVHHLPDVGEHVQDHLLSRLVYGTYPETSINREVQGWRLGLAAMNWFFRRQGPLTTGSAPVGGFAHTVEGLQAPDVQFFFASGATLYNARGRIKAMGVPAITGALDQSRPESRGTIHIKSTDPTVHPEIHANYLSTELDRITMVKGTRIMAKVFESEAMQPFITERMTPAPDFDLNDDEALLAHIRDDATTSYHPTSSCAIGKVVDPKLRIYGLDGISVADASVMPAVVSGNTNAACIMIGEKAADLLLQR